jgi:hypothetical protein
MPDTRNPNRWRESASAQAQDDLDGLFNLAITHATHLLKDGGRLVPFAAVVQDDGTAGVVVADPGGGASRAVLDRLYATARRDSAECRAVAFTADITFEDGRAIRIEAEHRDGIALALRVPYHRRFLGGVRLGVMRLSDGPSRVWR